MKTKIKILFYLICFLFLLPCSLLFGAVPQRWTVETSRVQPVVFDVVRGETVALEATFMSYGAPLAVTNGEAWVYWQTNGMGRAWWSAPATSNANVIAAAFTPDMDPGGAAVNGFLGSTSTSYRAAFTLRFRNGPGAIPNVIEKPIPILDLAHTTVINPPWPTSEDFAATTSVMRTELKGYVDSQIAGSGALTPSDATNAAETVVHEAVRTNYLCTVAKLASAQEEILDWGLQNLVTKDYNNTVGYNFSLKSAGGLEDIITYENSYWWFWGRTRWQLINEKPTTIQGYGITDAYTKAGTDSAIANATNDSWIVRGEFQGGNQWGITAANAQNSYRAERLEKSNEVFAIPSFSRRSRPSYTDNNGSTWHDVAYSQEVAQVQAQVSAIGAHLNAEDARFVVTNYDSQAHLAEASVEIMQGGSWLTIWREMTRWSAFVGQGFDWSAWGGFHAFKTNVTEEIDQKADRAWGAYDSETGAFAPDGYTWISSSRIAIAANMAYQKTVTSEGAIWVLESNGLVTETGGVTSNGYFRVSDDEGIPQFEIVKGDKRTVGADAASCQVVAGFSPTKLQIGYSIVSDDHPTIYVCNNLANPQWKAETDGDCLATVTWSGTSGGWVANVQGKSQQNALFVKATYEVGGDTIIRNAAPVEIQYLYIGGQKYAVGTATISGHTVLTLTQAN